MIDRSLMALLLTVLREQRDLACGTETNALFDELNLRSTQTVTTPLLREHIARAEDKGWVETFTGSLNERRIRITPAGCGALSDLRRGG
jgi:DNA-binding MarR family transcriptional regulator